MRAIVAILAVLVSGTDSSELRDRLFAISEALLTEAGLHVDRSRSWLTVSEPLPAGAQFDVRPLWDAGSSSPSLPLQFELRPIERSDATPVRATLGVTLLRDVHVVRRRLRKGSAISCLDLEAGRRNVRYLSARVKHMHSCDLGHDAVARRDLSAGDVLLEGDTGSAPDIEAGQPVQVTVASRGIEVSTSGVAVNDAWVGDETYVRLDGPARTLRARVTAPGAVQLQVRGYRVDARGVCRRLGFRRDRCGRLPARPGHLPVSRRGNEGASGR